MTELGFMLMVVAKQLLMVTSDEGRALVGRNPKNAFTKKIKRITTKGRRIEPASSVIGVSMISDWNP